MTWLSGLACGLLAAVAPGIVMLLLWLLMPALLALRYDPEPGRPVARTVLTCGLAFCVRPVMALWNVGYSSDAAFALLADPGVFGPPWSAAAAGWLAAQLLPIAVRVGLDAAALARAARLKAARAKLAEAWGLDPAGDAS